MSSELKEQIVSENNGVTFRLISMVFNEETNKVIEPYAGEDELTLAEEKLMERLYMLSEALQGIILNSITKYLDLRALALVDFGMEAKPLLGSIEVFNVFLSTKPKA